MVAIPPLFHAATRETRLEVIHPQPTARALRTTSLLVLKANHRRLGTGSYSDPVTLATSKYNPAFSQCEVIYLPYFQKYFQMADHCVACGKLAPIAFTFMP